MKRGLSFFLFSLPSHYLIFSTHPCLAVVIKTKQSRTFIALSDEIDAHFPSVVFYFFKFILSSKFTKNKCYKLTGFIRNEFANSLFIVVIAQFIQQKQFISFVIDLSKC